MDEALKILVGMGPGGLIAAFMFYQWREERAERRELQRENTVMLRDKIQSDNALAQAVEKIADKVGA